MDSDFVLFWRISQNLKYLLILSHLYVKVGGRRRRKHIKRSPLMMIEMMGFVTHGNAIDNTGVSSLDGGAGGALAPPDFFRTVNPISTRRDRSCPPNNTGTPGFSDLPKALTLGVTRITQPH